MIPTKEKLLGRALCHLEKCGLHQPYKTAKAYANYLAAFGPSLRQNGLEATLLMYQVEAQGGRQQRGPLLALINELLKDEEAGLLGAEERTSFEGSDSALHYAESLDISGRRRFQDQLERAVVALKLAIRTHKLKADAHEEE